MSGAISKITAEYFRINQYQIFCRMAGRGDTVLLLHGFPTSSFIWRRMIPEVAKTHKVIAPDMLGYGRSDKPLNVEYSIDYHASILNELIDRLAPLEIDLIVHDLGGPVGMLWAIENPRRVRRLIILNSIASAEYVFRDKLALTLMDLPLTRNLFATRIVLRQILKSDVYNADRMNEELLAEYLLSYKNRSDHKVMVRTFVDLLKGKSRSILRGISCELPKLKTPIYLISGQHDPHCRMYMKKMEKVLPEAVCEVLPECGHFIQEDQPDLLNQILIKCLTSKEDKYQKRQAGLT